MKSGIPRPTEFFARHEIFPCVSRVTGLIVQFNESTSFTTFPPKRQMYSCAGGRPSSETPQVNVMDSPFITVSTSFCKNAGPGGSENEWKVQRWVETINYKYFSICVMWYTALLIFVFRLCTNCGLDIKSNNTRMFTTKAIFLIFRECHAENSFLEQSYLY